MGQKKGRTGNLGGRPKGSLNKSTLQTRQFIASLLEDNKEQIISDLMMIEPFQRLQMYEKFMSYIVPKANIQTQLTVDINKLTESDLDTIINQISIGANEDEE